MHKKETMTSVYFYFPYMDESGVPVLFLRMSRWLSIHYAHDYECFVIDYSDGAMARNLTDEDKVKLLQYDDNEICFIDDDAIIVFQSFNPSFWPQNLKLSSGTKIVWWTLHARCLSPTLIPVPFDELTFKYHWLYKLCALLYYPFIHGFANMVDDMISHGALYFMDYDTLYETIKHLPIKLKKVDHFLPVPASDYYGELKSARNSEVLNVCWLGRLCDEKTPILKYAISKLADYAMRNKRHIEMYVLGYGSHQEEIDNLGFDNAYYHQRKARSIRYVDINNFLLRNIDLMFAQATSALESAKLGIPTVVTDDSLEDLHGDYIFKMLHERKNYDIGHLVTEKDYEPNNSSFEDIMNKVTFNYNEVSILSREHFVQYHSLTSIGQQFVKDLKKSNYTFDMIDSNIIQPLWTWKLYSRVRRIFEKLK